MERLHHNVYILFGTEEIEKIDLDTDSLYIVPCHRYISSGREKWFEKHFNAIDIKRNLGNHSKVLILANSLEEKENLLTTFSEEQVVFCSRHFQHGQKTNPYVYRDLGLQKEYDFIFNGSSKKHTSVLEGLPNLCILNRFVEKPDIDCKYYNDVLLSPEEVNVMVNKSKIGIMTTELEGVSWASLEYLMCGIPVISCKSKGGRDVYYTKNNSVIHDIKNVACNKHYKEELREVCIDTLNNIDKFDKNVIIKECLETCRQHKMYLVNRLNQMIPDMDAFKVMSECKTL